MLGLDDQFNSKKTPGISQLYLPKAISANPPDISSTKAIQINKGQRR